MVFDSAPVYRYSMCNGTEYNFYECQLPIPDSDSMCPSFATVNCTEGLHDNIITIILLLCIQISYDCVYMIVYMYISTSCSCAQQDAHNLA